jgi:hypothetical protein
MTYDFTNTTADPRAKNQWGIVRRDGKTVILVPPHDVINSHRNGLVMIDNISVESNRVVAEIISERYARNASPNRKVNQTDVEKTISTYFNYIVGVLTGKNGMLRSSMMPVFPHTVRAVMTPYVSEDGDPLRIMIPRSAFRRLRKKSEKFYDHYETRQNWYCVLKRDPVHREQNVIAVSFDLWDNKTIGVSPLLINSIDGDYDGDAGVAMFPVSTIGMADLTKLMPEFSEIFDPGKQLKDATSVTAFDLLKKNVGWCSTFKDPHNSDELKNPLLFSVLEGNPSMSKLGLEAITAVKDFETIKDGTALTGALGLQFISSRNADDIRMLKESMELYHVLAQNTLDAKAGTAVPAYKVVDAFNRIRMLSRSIESLNSRITDAERRLSGEMLRRKLKPIESELEDRRQEVDLEKERIRSALEELEYTDEQCISELVTMALRMGKYGSKSGYYVEHAPVLGCIQQGNRPREIIEVAKRYVSGTTMGDGIWEKLLDFLLGRGNDKLFTISTKLIGQLPQIREKLAGKSGE